MPKSPLDQFHPTEREILTKLAEARKVLVRFNTPRARECIRTIDDVGKEITGDERFFHTHGHSIP